METQEITQAVAVETAKLLALNERKIEILEAIRSFQRMIVRTEDTMNSLNELFPTRTEKRDHQIDIYNRCINRLYKKYQSIES